MKKNLLLLTLLALPLAINAAEVTAFLRHAKPSNQIEQKALETFFQDAEQQRTKIFPKTALGTFKREEIAKLFAELKKEKIRQNQPHSNFFLSTYRSYLLPKKSPQANTTTSAKPVQPAPAKPAKPTPTVTALPAEPAQAEPETVVTQPKTPEQLAEAHQQQLREAHQQQLKEREAQPFIDEHNAWVAVEEDYKEAYKITQIREEEAQRKAQRDAEKAQRQKEEAQRAADRQARREEQQALELAKRQKKQKQENDAREAEMAAAATAKELQREKQLATGAAAAASEREEHIGLDLAHMARLVKLTDETDERVAVSVHLCPNCSTYNPKKACLVQPINRALNKDEKRSYETIQKINRDLQKANKNPQQKVTIPFPQKGMAPYESFLEQVGIFDNKMAIIDAIAILNPLETILSKSWEHVGPSKQPAEPVNENTLSTQEQQEPLAASASPSVVIDKFVKKQPGEKLPVSCDLDAFLNLLNCRSKKTMNVINQTGDLIHIQSIIESEVKEKKKILPTQFNLLEIRPYSGFHLPSGKFIIIENYQENKIFFALVVFVQKDANGRFVETAYCIDRNGIILDPATTGITLKHEDEDDLTF